MYEYNRNNENRIIENDYNNNNTTHVNYGFRIYWAYVVFMSHGENNIYYI